MKKNGLFILLMHLKQYIMHLKIIAFENELFVYNNTSYFDNKHELYLRLNIYYKSYLFVYLP